MRCSPSASTSRALEPPEEISEQQELELEEETIPLTNFSSSSPDEAVIPPPPSVADDFRSFQDLTKRVADTLQIPLEEVRDTHHKLLDILHTSSTSRITLPINKALLNLAKLIWKTPASATPMCKWADKKYYVLPKDSEFLFFHLISSCWMW